MVHADGAGHPVIFVADVVADQLGAGVVHRAAATLHRRGGVGVLAALLDLLARVATTDRTGDRGERLALATTNLITQHAADDGADGRTGNLVLILGRRGGVDHLVVA